MSIGGSEGNNDQPRHTSSNQGIWKTPRPTSPNTHPSIHANYSVPVPTYYGVYSTKILCSTLCSPSNTNSPGSNNRPNDPNDNIEYSVSLAADVADSVKTVKQYHHPTHRVTKLESGLLQVVVPKWESKDVFGVYRYQVYLFIANEFLSLKWNISTDLVYTISYQYLY